MKLRSGLLISALGVALAVLLAKDPAAIGVAWPGSKAGAGAPQAAASAPHPVWREVRWPFLIDEWGIGRAYRCASADCGIEVNLYLRPKIGFCNCATGVSDNADLDRVSDLQLYSEDFVGVNDGHPVNVGRLKGRSRLYQVNIPYAGARNMFAIGFNDRCDVAVATVVTDPVVADPVVADPDGLTRAEGLALDFLSSDPVQRWAAAELGQSGL
jgi:hypothetical protein